MSRVEAETLSVDEAAQVLGISRHLAYAQARKGHIAGIPVIRVGRRLLIPRKPLERALGIDYMLNEEVYGEAAA